MKDLITFIAKALVDHPEQVEVTETEEGQVTLVKLKTAKDDLGKVIGKHGRMAQAMRTILGASARKLDRQCTLEIIE